MKLILSFLLFASLAGAGVIGDSVNISADFPTLGTVFVDGGTHTIDGSVEWPEGSFPGYNNSISIQITASQFILSFNGAPTTFQSASFNGFDVNFLTGSMLGAVPDPSSNYNPVISISGQHLYLNYEGETVTAGQLSIIDLTGTGPSTVPEPASAALLGTALVALGLLRRRWMARFRA